MTKTQSAIGYFESQNKNPSGTKKKISAYIIAEKTLKDMKRISYILSEAQQGMISEYKACSEIADILRE